MTAPRLRALVPGDSGRLVKLLRARHPCLSIVTNDEAWANTTIVAAALDCGLRAPLSWSAMRGLCNGIFADAQDQRPDTTNPLKALRQIMREEHVKVTVLFDLSAHLDDPLTLRALREVIERCRAARTTLVLVDHQDRLPEIIARSAISFELSLPDDAELEAIVRESVRRLKVDEPAIAVHLSGADLGQLVRNLRGLTRSQAEGVIADVAVEDDALDARDVVQVLQRKRRLLHIAGLLEHVDVPVSMDEVAGVAALKRWLAVRRLVIDDPPPGIDTPRGILLLGVPGSGKSLCAKAIATAWQRPLLRLDAGVLYDKFVGESESRLRQALKQAEALAPMVLWVDEIEKAFASAASQSSDGGLSQRMFASLLTWMQERTAPVFLVATANDIEALPPELLRKGRFDEIFFVDLPDGPVRRAIFQTHLVRRGHDASRFDLALLAERAERFSGAEIEQAIVAAALEAHADGLPLDDARIVAALAATAPLAVTMAERIERLRAWASGRCVDASGAR